MQLALLDTGQRALDEIDGLQSLGVEDELLFVPPGRAAALGDHTGWVVVQVREESQLTVDLLMHSVAINGVVELSERGMGRILEAVEIMPDTGYAAMTWQFWFLLAGVLFLATISLLQSGRGGGYDD